MRASVSTPENPDRVLLPPIQAQREASSVRKDGDIGPPTRLDPSTLCTAVWRYPEELSGTLLRVMTVQLVSQMPLQVTCSAFAFWSVSP